MTDVLARHNSVSWGWRGFHVKIQGWMPRPCVWSWGMAVPLKQPVCYLCFLIHSPPPWVLSRRGWTFRSVAGELGLPSWGVPQSEHQAVHISSRVTLISDWGMFGKPGFFFPFWGKSHLQDRSPAWACSLDIQLSPCLTEISYVLSPSQVFITPDCECRWLDYVSVRECINIPNPGAVTSHVQHITFNLSRLRCTKCCLQISCFCSNICQCLILDSIPYSRKTVEHGNT